MDFSEQNLVKITTLQNLAHALITCKQQKKEHFLQIVLPDLLTKKIETTYSNFTNRAEATLLGRAFIVKSTASLIKNGS